jgi:Carboxypeptidase regulatory-like domain
MSTRHTTGVMSLAAALLATVTTGARQREVIIGTPGELRIEQNVTMGGPMGPGGPLKPMPTGTGLVVGQAVDAAGSRGVPGTLVTLTLPGATPLRVMADGQGRFAFRDLPKGRFSLTATKPGFVDGAYGRLRPGGQSQSIEIGEGERVSNASITLWKFAAVSGAVVDERGEPVVGSSVRVLKRTLVSGKPRLTPGALDQTDDRGFYRIGMLEPGDYIVVVPLNTQAGMMAAIEGMARSGTVDVMAAAPVMGSAFSFTSAAPSPMTMMDMLPGGGDGRVQPTQFYPAANTASRATLIPLGSGEDRGGIDFQLRSVRGSRVSGTVMGPEGPAANLLVTMVPAEADEMISSIETATASTDGAGAFTFTGVAPGQYVLRAVRTPRMAGAPTETTMFQSDGQRMVVATRSISINTATAQPMPNDPTLYAEQPVSVGTEDLADLGISLRTGIKVTGQVEFSGGADRPTADQLAAISVVLEPADVRVTGASSSVRGRVEQTGVFQTLGAIPGRYFVRAMGAPQGWTFRGATHGGRDVTDLPIELESGDVGGVVLVFTDRQTSLSGTVSGEGGTPDPTASVIVFPAQREAWSGYGMSPRRLQNLRVDPKGAYSVSTLPPGSYYVAAVRDAGAQDWQDPRFLEALMPLAELVDVNEGQKVSKPLKVVR